MHVNTMDAALSKNLTFDTIYSELVILIQLSIIMAL